MPCSGKRHVSYEAAMRARWVMAQQGTHIDTEKLRPEQCKKCDGWHLRRIQAEPITQRHNTYWECQDCGYEWLAPKASSCPKCFGQAITNHGGKRCDYIRA